MRSPSAVAARSPTLEWSLLVTALLLLALALAAWRWREYDAARAVERQRLEVQTSGLGGQLALTMQAVDSALSSARDEGEAATGTDFRSLVSARLATLDQASPAIDDLEIVDASGVVLASSGPDEPQGLIAAQACFKRARTASGPDLLYLCEPFLSRAGTWETHILRIVQGSGGRFGGVADARLDTKYLGTILLAALYAADMRAQLIHANGVLIVSSRPSVTPPGTDFSKNPRSLFSRYRATGQAAGTVEGIAYTGNQKNTLVSFYTVRIDGARLDNALVVSLSRSAQAAYQPWLVASGWLAAVWGVAAGASAFVLQLAQRRRRVREQQAMDLQKHRLEELERIELVVGAAELSMWVWHVADDRLDTDRRWSAMIGCAEAELTSVAHGWRDRIHPADIATIDEMIARHLSGELPFAQYEFRMRHEDGHWVWLHARGKVIERDAAGAALRVAGTHQDITERKAAEQALLRSETQTRLITDALPSAVARLDIERRFLFTNPALELWLGEPGRAVLGRKLCDVFGPQAAAATEALVLRVEAGEPVSFETTLETPRHGEMLVLAHLTPDFDPNGVVCGHVSIMTDLTERRVAEMERRALEDHIRESQKMESIGTLAGGIAHDFNNVLGAIIGNTELALLAVGPEHPASQSLQQIGQAGRRARGLVQQILAFSRRQVQERVNQPLRPLVEETASMLRATLPARVTLTTELTDAPLYVNADATQIHQVLMNLGTNAWHALHGGSGHIGVGLEGLLLADSGPTSVAGLPGGQYAHLWVSDDGVGMDAAIRQRIFEPFFTTKAIGQGTGLGLSVVHGIVRSHLGAITVESEPGRQTCFHVYLPASSRPSQVGALDEAEARVMQGRGQHVMYVDDDETMVLLVERLLDRAGYRVTGCKSARQALAAFTDRPREFDLLVTDFNMPDFSGLELAAEMAQIRPDLPVILSSGYLGDELRADALQSGIRHVMQKQNTFEELARLVHRALAQAEIERESMA